MADNSGDSGRVEATQFGRQRLAVHEGTDAIRKWLSIRGASVRVSLALGWRAWLVERLADFAPVRAG